MSVGTYTRHPRTPDGIRKRRRKAEPLTDEQRAFAERHLDICFYVAARFAKTCPAIQREDFYQAAFEGLADAVKGFDPGRGLKFESYAPRRVAGACLDMMRDEGTVRVPKAARKEGLDPAVTSILSIDRVVALKYEETSASEVILPPADVPPPWAALAAVDDFEALLVGLTAREKSVMRMLYGAVPLTMKQVGCRFDMSESRISQMHAACCERIRERAIRLGVRRPTREGAAS